MYRRTPRSCKQGGRRCVKLQPPEGLRRHDLPQEGKALLQIVCPSADDRVGEKAEAKVAVQLDGAAAPRLGVQADREVFLPKRGEDGREERPPQPAPSRSRFTLNQWTVFTRP